MNRREFIELCVAGTIATVLPADAFALPGNIINQINRYRYPRKFAYAISGNLSNKLGESSNQVALARFDAVILNIYGRNEIRYSGKTWQEVIANIKTLNPDILLGAYTIIEETKNISDALRNPDIDKYTKVQQENWWLHAGSGEKIRSYGPTCAINGSSYSSPDAQGMRWPQWLAQRDFDKFFNPALTTDQGFDIWFVDNIRNRSLYLGDWNENGGDDLSTGATALAAYRGMNLEYFAAMRALAPQKILMGNAPNDLSMYPQALDASLNEAMFGKSWSPGGYPPWGQGHDRSWINAMNQYNAQFNNVGTDLVAFHAHGLSTDYQLFRYALCSCLLNNGFISYSDNKVGYVAPPWFDEYDHDLGVAISPPQTAMWSNGVWRRDFENGISLVNPTQSARTVTIEAGYHRIPGVQDVATNSGVSATGPLIIPSRDGIVLKRS